MFAQFEEATWSSIQCKHGLVCSRLPFQVVGLLLIETFVIILHVSKASVVIRINIHQVDLQYKYTLIKHMVKQNKLTNIMKCKDKNRLNGGLVGVRHEETPR